jgi:hypothetical protein
LGESRPGNIIILDDVLCPYFIDDRTASIGYTGDPHEFIVDIGDDFGVSEVGLEILQNDHIIFNGSMRSTYGSEWRYSFTVPHSIDPLRYRFHAFDFRRNTNVSVFKTVSILDNDPPIIEIERLPEIATTGDEMIVECSLYDYIGVEGGWLEIKGNGHETDPIDLVDVGSGIWSSSYVVPSNNINDIHFSINATDGSNYNRTPWRTVPVLDNDAPELMGDSSDPVAFNDREFDIVLEMVDNIGVSDVWCHVVFDNGPYLNVTMDNLEGDIYSGFTDIPISSSQFSYTPYALDGAGNQFSGNQTLFDVTDSISPDVIDDMSPSQGYTGDPFEFSVSVGDNIGIDKVTVEYRFGDQIAEKIEMIKVDNFEVGIVIPPNSTEELHYHFIVRDVNGNTRTSRESTVEILDNDAPSLTVSAPPSKAETGDVLKIEIEITDNISPELLLVEVVFDGEPWKWDNISMVSDIIDEWELELPLDRIGDLSLYFLGEDGSGNGNSSGPYSISIIDVIPPVITPLVNFSVNEGENFVIEIKADDNIGISSYSWEGLPYLSSNGTWSGSIDESGEYLVSVTVCDEEGNQDTMSFTITVKNREENNYSHYILITIFIVISIAISTWLVLRYVGNRRKNDDEVRDASSSGDADDEVMKNVDDI